MVAFCYLARPVRSYHLHLPRDEAFMSGLPPGRLAADESSFMRMVDVHGGRPSSPWWMRCAEWCRHGVIMSNVTPSSMLTILPPSLDLVPHGGRGPHVLPVPRADGLLAKAACSAAACRRPPAVGRAPRPAAAWTCAPCPRACAPRWLRPPRL